MKLPALLISTELKRKVAKDKVRKAIESIKIFGVAAGFSDKTLLEFFSLAHSIEREILNDERDNKAEIFGGLEKQPIPANNTHSV